MDSERKVIGLFWMSSRTSTKLKMKISKNSLSSAPYYSFDELHWTWKEGSELNMKSDVFNLLLM